MNNLKKCQSCGKIFGYMGKPICPDCIKKLDDEFAKVRNYIYDNPNANMDDVAKDTEVELKTIKQFLREGRLQLRNADGALLCEKCGRPLTSGTMCEDCKNGLMKTLGGAVQKPEPEKPAKQEKTGFKERNKLHIDFKK